MGTPATTPLDRIRRFGTRAGEIYAAGAAAHAVIKAARAWYAARHTFAVTVRSEDPIYSDVHEWLLGLIPNEQRRSLLVRSADRWSHGDETLASADDGSGRRPPRLLLSYDDNVQQVVEVAGHQVKVTVTKPTEGKEFRMAPETITFAASSLAGQDAVVAHLQGIVKVRAVQKRRPTLWMLSSWGSWTRRAEAPGRELDSVVLCPGQLERLVDDVGAFLEAEDDYIRRGVPYHRGLLLHGRPGTGKTSVAKAIANHYGLDLFYAPLGDLDKDTKLLNLLSEVHPRAMLLLEDVDVFAATHDRDAEKGQVSLSGLLNALDGVSTPHGLITVLTTNRADVFDEALVRPGRIDLVEELGYPDDNQAARMFFAWYGTRPTSQVHAGGRSQAEIAETFKAHMNDPGGAERALTRRLSVVPGG